MSNKKLNFEIEHLPSKKDNKNTVEGLMKNILSFLTISLVK
jgi:hypothetical protein